MKKKNNEITQKCEEDFNYYYTLLQNRIKEENIDDECKIYLSKLELISNLISKEEYKNKYQDINNKIKEKDMPPSYEEIVKN